MAYKSTTIREVIADIEDSKMYLPALQRKFVWGKYQIELLFDSIMRNFPIGTFLFWKLKNEVANNYVFYEFLTEYDQRSPYNKRKTGSFLKPEIIGVLDGQQRLSSMYIGLQGTHTEKAPYMRWADDNAYRKSFLFLNILSLPFKVNQDNNIETKEEQNFEFRFLTADESKNWINRKSKITDEDGNEKQTDEQMLWFKVGDVLKWNNDPEFDLMINNLVETSSNELQKNDIEKQRRFIKKAFEILKDRFIKEQIINYFEVSKEELEDILKIFIRVNSGGTQLSKTDLLFSTIVATWDNGREEIESLIQKINRKGNGFNFGNEYLMRCCLVLTDAPVLYKVNSFKSENVEKIKTEWQQIANAIDKTVDLLVEFGFDGNSLTSQNATLLIAYYLKKEGLITDETKISIKKYLIHSMLNGIYGSSQDNVIASFRNAIRQSNKNEAGKTYYCLKSNTFSFDELLKHNLPSRKTLYITDIELDNFMSYKKGASSFFVLNLLYPQLKYKEVTFHQDHIHPFSRFNEEQFDLLNIPKEDRQQWYNLRDTIPNLQLMEGTANESKNATPFKIWLDSKETFEQNIFLVSNYIPDNTSFEFSNFLAFYNLRKEKLKNELKKVLAINNEVQLTNTEYLEQEGVLEDN